MNLILIADFGAWRRPRTSRTRPTLTSCWTWSSRSWTSGDDDSDDRDDDNDDNDDDDTRLVSLPSPLRAHRRYEVLCQVIGARPAPALTWTLTSAHGLVTELTASLPQVIFPYPVS